jgi:hypothetical protein
MKGILHLPKDLIQKLAIQYIDDVESFAQSHPYFRRCIDMDNIHRKKEQYNYPNDRIRIFATKLVFENTKHIEFRYKDLKDHIIQFYHSTTYHHGIIMEILNENEITQKLFGIYPIKWSHCIGILYNISPFGLFDFVYKILQCGYSCRYFKTDENGVSRKYLFN